MNLSEIIDFFRVECADITDRRITDTLLKNWCLPADKEVCVISRCIVSDFTITSVASTTVYNTKYNLLTAEPKFYDIDEYPGGGVSYDNDPLDEKTPSELDLMDSGWRTSSAGIPDYYYRRGQFLYFNRPIQTAGKTIRVYASLVSDDFTNDAQEPFNSLSYLEPFHYAIVKYLVWKAKAMVGKPQEASIAQKKFYDYCAFMKKEVLGGKGGAIYYRPPAGVYNPLPGRHR